MDLIYDPFPLILTRGDESTKLACLEFFGLADSPTGKECLLALMRKQRSDGAFPSSLDPLQWGTRETTRSALLMLQADLPPDGINIDGAVRFVLPHSNPEEGWTENPALRIPEQMIEITTQRSVTWITADVVELLRQVGLRECPECRTAVQWLRTMQGERGGWPMYTGDVGQQLGTGGDPDSTAQITFLMRRMCGESDSAYLKGRELLETYFDERAAEARKGYRIRLRDGRREPVGVYELTHLLLSSLVDPPDRIDLGYNVTDPRVRQMMKALVSAQRPDGGWRPLWAQESDPVYTVLAVETLALTGAASTSALRSSIQAHASL